jgi:protein-disulfide isomerase
MQGDGVTVPVRNFPREAGFSASSGRSIARQGIFDDRHVMSSRLLAVVLLQVAVACAGSSPRTSDGPVSMSTPSAEPANGAEVAVPVAQAPQPSSEALPIDDDDIVWGSPTAPVTLVEFTDLQCSFCVRVSSTLATLMRDYGPEKLRVVIKHNPLPFHERAFEAARFAQAVTDLGGSDAGLRFVQRSLLAQDDLERPRFAEYARELGLDPVKVEARADSAEVLAAVRRDVALAKATGVVGTPSFFANGVKIAGAQPISSFKEAIDAELAKAAELARAGTPADRIFSTLVARDLKLPQDEPPAPQPEPEPVVWKVPTAGAAARGAAKPLVTIVEFTDYQCPFCKRAEATIQELMERYADDVRLVVRHNPLPFHKQARPAAALALEARAQRGDATFFKVASRLFEQAPELDRDALLAIAREFKLNEARVKAALDKGTHDQTIEADMELAGDLGATGVPQFFINGVVLTGAQPLEKFVEVVESEREKASVLVAQGTPRAKVYDEIMKTAREPNPPEQKVVPVPADSPSRGPKNAPVVIQVFNDFQCPFCARVQVTLTVLDRKYPGQIRWVFRNLPLPFHKQARPAALAALEVRAQQGDRAFWTMHDRLFAAQYVAGGLSEEKVNAIAEDMGIDMYRFRAALEDGRHEAAVTSDIEAAKQAGIEATPSFLINDYYLSGAQPIAAFEKLIKRAKAQRGASSRQGNGKKPAP